MRSLLFVTLVTLAVTAFATTDRVSPVLEGSRIVASDGTFLGVVSRSRHDPNSIANRRGQYGSVISAASIFNRHGKYGALDSDLSAFNPRATHPPKLISSAGLETFETYLTMNPSVQPHLQADFVVGWSRH